MQGLADGYFIIPYTIGDYLAGPEPNPVDPSHTAFGSAEQEIQNFVERLMNVKGKKTVTEFHRDLGLLMWDQVGMSRNKEGLNQVIQRIPELREEFWKDVNVPGDPASWNKNLEYAGRLIDFFELGELMAIDALHRKESCGGHFREEYQTEESEALRNDEEYSHVAAWEYAGDEKEPILHKEPLAFEYVKPSQRSYK